MSDPAIDRKLLLVLLGGPGAGKGTQAELLQSRMGLVHLSSGDLFRALESRSDRLARLIKEKISAGDLVPDELTTQLITAEVERLCAIGPGVVIDGFPRTSVQAKLFDDWLSSVGGRIAAVVHLKVDNAVKVNRSLHRGRSDDRPEIIDHRIAVYDAATRPVFDHYLEQGLIFDVDGDRPVDAIGADIDALIAARSQGCNPLTAPAGGVGSSVRCR
ncbi:MAG: nucleoside monophosphate kinase [Chloroflexi bacterium]|nr:nucleoside monophosphate kinase [Chloroflexota bacterium]